MEIITLTGLVGFGLIFGSFANALVWRVHSQEVIREKIAELKQRKSGKSRDKQLQQLREQLKPLSMSRGRSMCSNCHHPLVAKDLLPLLSWLWLRGKCRYCQQPIQDPPLLEAGLALVFAVSYLTWPLGFHGYGLLAFGLWLVFLTGFAALTLYDLRWYILPDRVVWPLVALAAGQVLLHATVFNGGLSVVGTALWGVIIASGLFYILYQVSDGQWIGGGDVKLGLVLGLLVGGPLPALLLIFIASLLGSLASLPLLIQGKLGRKSVIPFGPFLMIAAVIMVQFGGALIDGLTKLVFLE
jgi:prepilin signal peptidase PulO-like enzyme (type II secretory pathway)